MLSQARRRPGVVRKTTPWLISYSDMITLMLAFFVLLVALSSKDERRSLAALASLDQTFGVTPEPGPTKNLVQTQGGATAQPAPGPLDPSDLFGLTQRALDAELKGDVTFSSNVFVQTISINDFVFFQPGETGLTAQGKKALDFLLPLLFNVTYPVLIAGHAGTPRDESTSLDLLPEPFASSGADASWRVSLERGQAIFRYLVERGVNFKMLRVEGFGQFRPKFTMDTPEGRKRNRRVDVVFDKRNTRFVEWLGPAKAPEDRNNYIVNDFRFDVTLPTPEKKPEDRP